LAAWRIFFSQGIVLQEGFEAIGHCFIVANGDEISGHSVNNHIACAAVVIRDAGQARRICAHSAYGRRQWGYVKYSMRWFGVLSVQCFS